MSSFSKITSCSILLCFLLLFNSCEQKSPKQDLEDYAKELLGYITKKDKQAFEKNFVTKPIMQDIVSDQTGKVRFTGFWNRFDRSKSTYFEVFNEVDMNNLTLDYIDARVLDKSFPGSDKSYINMDKATIGMFRIYLKHKDELKHTVIEFRDLFKVPSRKEWLISSKPLVAQKPILPK